ncbi:MAG: hypothetical protein PHW69_09285, partial [Elusimicrobiaceae bacterium]|nr:hypothetical protein [Elusimicrobiaceae bacterium]
MTKTRILLALFVSAVCGLSFAADGNVSGDLRELSASGPKLKSDRRSNKLVPGGHVISPGGNIVWIKSLSADYVFVVFRDGTVRRFGIDEVQPAVVEPGESLNGFTVAGYVISPGGNVVRVKAISKDYVVGIFRDGTEWCFDAKEVQPAVVTPGESLNGFTVAGYAMSPGGNAVRVKALSK